MKSWSMHDAKARFSELVEACIADGPQMVTKRGVDAAVLVPFALWRRMEQSAHPSLKQWLKSDLGRVDDLTPAKRVIRRCKADLLVSSDDDLLVLSPWCGVPILRPMAFLSDSQLKAPDDR